MLNNQNHNVFYSEETRKGTIISSSYVNLRYPSTSTTRRSVYRRGGPWSGWRRSDEMHYHCRVVDHDRLTVRVFDPSAPVIIGDRFFVARL